MRPLAIALFVASAAILSAPYQQTLRLACTADTNLSSYEGERRYNYGASTHLRLKGIQMMGLFRFDIGPVRGKLVRAARLHLRYAGPTRMLRTLGISTITTAWDEGSGRGEERPGEVCFEAARLGVRPWRADAADLAEVMFAPPNLWTYTDVQNGADGWISAEISPDIVQALAAGVATGIIVTDEKGQTFANNDVFSREQSDSEPYLTVVAQPAPAAEPPTLGQLKVEPAYEAIGTRTTALRIVYRLAPPAFAVRCTVQSAGRSEPLYTDVLSIAKRGEQRCVLSPLPPGRDVRVTLQPIDATGQQGAPVTRRSRTPSPRPLPEPLRPALWRSLLRPCPIWRVGGLTVVADGPNARAKPLAPITQPSAALWNGREIEIHVARAERTGMSLLLQSSPGSREEVELRTSLPFPAKTSIVRCVEDAMVPDICLPVRGRLPLSDPTAASLGQFVHQALVEWTVPTEAPKGVHRGSVVVRVRDGNALTIPVAIHVHPLDLSQTPAFDLVLNTYGSPARACDIDPATPAGIETEHRFHRLARSHGAVLMPLGYSHSGTVEPGYAPDTTGSGETRHVSDWSGWDQRFAPLLTGEALRDGSNYAEPISDLYLPFHEMWPEDLRSAYRYVPATRDYPQIIAEHAMRAGPLDEMVEPGYAAGIRNVVRDFAEHIRARGWTHTRFHFYLNNKYYYRDPAQGGRGTSWWLLDEPMHRDDWLALAWFARREREGVAGIQDHGIVFRADISRPQWQRDYLDGLLDLMVVNDELFRRPALIQRRREQGLLRLWHYGSPPTLKEPLAACEAWPVRAFLAGASGIVPWQSVGRREHYRTAEPTALILPGPERTDGPVSTLRLKALARGAQTVGYLELLKTRNGWTLEQVSAAVAPFLADKDFDGLRASILQRLAPLTTQSSARTHAAHRTGQALLGWPRSPRPKP